MHPAVSLDLKVSQAQLVLQGSEDLITTMCILNNDVDSVEGVGRVPIVDGYLMRNELAELRPVFFFFSSRRRHTRFDCDWSSDVCSSDLSSTRRRRSRSRSATPRATRRGSWLPTRPAT